VAREVAVANMNYALRATAGLLQDREQQKPPEDHLQGEDEEGI
jgi:hypothetical protein